MTKSKGVSVNNNKKPIEKCEEGHPGIIAFLHEKNNNILIPDP